MAFTSREILIGITNPIFLIIYLLRKFPFPFFYLLRLHIDGLDRTYYGYCLLQAANEAKKLGIRRISTMEFGVAGGHGLINLEKHAEQISRITGVEIDVYGFDMGSGLPAPLDYRDLPYIWEKGFYKMDAPTLRKKIKNSTQLIIGDVSSTIPRFIKKKIAPIGFIAFDLDFYTSTKDAFLLFEAEKSKLLPRIFCYFDDVIGTDEEIHSEYGGELLAISEFNKQSFSSNKKFKKRKICKINGLFHKRAVKSAWSDMVFVMHIFDHKLYNKYIYSSIDRQNLL